MNDQPLILTLTFDQATFELLDGLRQQHFPPERNFIPAHALYTQLAAGWQRHEGIGQGLLLWRYRGGPWELAGEFPFRG